jgi:hypothetical protein
MVNKSWFEDKIFYEHKRALDSAELFKCVKLQVTSMDCFVINRATFETINGHSIVTYEMQNGSVYFGYLNDVQHSLQSQIIDIVFSRLGL